MKKRCISFLLAAILLLSLLPAAMAEEEPAQPEIDIAALTEARSEFNSLIGQINQVLQFIVTGRMDEGGCSGSCDSCKGCH